MTKGWEAIWEAAKQLDSDLSGMSWNGFNLAGDKKSIDELKRLIHCEERLRWFEEHWHKFDTQPSPHDPTNWNASESL